MPELDITSTIEMNNNRSIPRLGLGVFQMQEPRECERAVCAAIDQGYRHVDTAAVYGNEEAVGKGIAASGVPREELFITTKCWIDAFGRRETVAACEESLRRLGLDYVDLYLLHWPLDASMMQAWEACVALQETGKAHSIGVSNWTVRRLQEAFLPKTGVVPQVNQIELHPFNNRADVRACCARHGIVVTAYSPLARAQRLDDPVLREVAANHGKTVAQVMLRWNLQHGHVVIPKSVKPERIAQNGEIFDFELAAEEMADIDRLNGDLSVIDWRPPQEQWY